MYAMKALRRSAFFVAILAACYGPNTCIAKSTASTTRCEAGTNKATKTSKEKIDLNKAGVGDLKKIPAVGEKTARAIHDHGKVNKGYRSIE